MKSNFSACCHSAFLQVHSCKCYEILLKGIGRGVTSKWTVVVSLQLVCGSYQGDTTCDSSHVSLRQLSSTGGGLRWARESRKVGRRRWQRRLCEPEKSQNEGRSMGLILHTRQLSLPPLRVLSWSQHMWICKALRDTQSYDTKSLLEAHSFPSREKRNQVKSMYPFKVYSLSPNCYVWSACGPSLHTMCSPYHNSCRCY